MTENRNWSSLDLSITVIALTVGLNLPLFIWLKYGWLPGAIAICPSLVATWFIFLGLQFIRIWLVSLLFALMDQLNGSNGKGGTGDRVMLLTVLLWFGLHAFLTIWVAQIFGFRQAVGLTLVFTTIAPMSFLLLSVICLEVAVRIRSCIKANGSGSN